MGKFWVALAFIAASAVLDLLGGLMLYIIGRVIAPELGLHVPHYWACFWVAFWVYALALVIVAVREFFSELLDG